MYGRLIRLVALGAVVTHLWVTMVVAPWHQLVAHRLPYANARQDSEASPSHKSCRCRHHSVPVDTPACDRPSKGPQDGSPPTPSHHHDDCPICQVLAQPFAPFGQTELSHCGERVESSCPVSAVRPSLEPLREPVSRGPPIS